MTTIQLSAKFVVNNFHKLLNSMDAGTYTSIDILDPHTGTQAGSGAVVAKLVTPTAFAAADLAVGNTAQLHMVPQAPYGEHPMKISYNGLYDLVKTVHKANAITDSNTTAYLNYLTGDGVDGLHFQAIKGGVGGDAITVALVDAGAGQTLAVTVVGTAISVRLATDGPGNITSTLTNIANILNGTAASAALIYTTVLGTGTVTPESTVATLQVTQGAGGVLYTSVAKGTASNNFTVRYLNPTVLGHSYYSYPDGVQGGNGIDFTAVAAGISPVTITVVDPGADHALTCGVVGNAITVTLAYALGAVTSTLDDVGNPVTGIIATTPAAAALVTTVVTGVAGTLATAMPIQTLSSLFVESAGLIGQAITVNLGTNAAGVVTSTATSVAAAATGVAAGLYTAVATGVGGTLAAAYVLHNFAGGTDDGTLAPTNLANGASASSSAKKFQAYELHRTAGFTRQAGLPVPTVTRAVLISKSHADYLGL